MIDPFTKRVIAACIEVHRAVGPGLLESVYEECLCHELRLQGFSFARQVVVPLHYKNLQLPCVYRVDLVVEDRLVIEVKAVETVLSVHIAQVYTYLALTGIDTGLLVNFHAARLIDGLRRLSNKQKPLPDLSSPISRDL